MVTARDTIGARVGDLVTIQSKSGPVLAAAAVLYFLPLALFFVGCLLGSVLLGCLGFVLGLALAVIFDRGMARKRKQVYIITGFAEPLRKEEISSD